VTAVLGDLERGSAHPIVLGCARDGRPRLGPIVEGLVARGHHVEVVSDLDTRNVDLLATLQRRESATRFVLFESPGLQLARLRDLEADLRSRGIPKDRIRIASADDGISSTLRPVPNAVPFPQTPMLDRSGSQPVVPSSPLASTRRGAPNLLRRPAIIAALGIAGVLVVSATVAFAMRSDDGQAVGSDGAKSESLESTAVALRSGAEAPDDEQKAVAPDPAIAPAAIADEGDDEGDAPIEEDEKDEKDEKDEEVEQDEDSPSAAAVEITEKEPAESDAGTDRTDDDAEAVYRALNEQKVRALDLLLIAPEPIVQWRKRTAIKKMSFEDATEHCAKLDIEGVTGWRLATIGELSSLTSGRMIERGKFWSVTKADTFGQSRVVWNSQTEKMGPAPTKWRDGRVLCVRPTVRPPSLVMDERTANLED
jgi:hypothetical protein